MKLERQLKIALDESRLLILGSQVLFGFQFNGIFQQQFESLAALSRALVCAGLPLLTVAIALLIAPSMEHRIVEQGQDTPRVLALATLFAATALCPIGVALALDIYVAMERIGPELMAATTAIAFFVLAMLCWYALAWVTKRKKQAMTQEVKPTPLETQVDQLLTEARVIIPGVQALLGFQLTVTFTQAFAQLEPAPKIVHAVALCAISLAVILLMAPASLHRIAFAGQDDPAFLAMGTIFVIAAPFPLALGIALDTYVAAGRALQSDVTALILAASALVALLAFWYVLPLWRRVRS